MAPSLRKVYYQLPEPRYVISMGRALTARLLPLFIFVWARLRPHRGCRRHLRSGLPPAAEARVLYGVLLPAEEDRRPGPSSGEVDRE